MKSLIIIVSTLLVFIMATSCGSNIVTEDPVLPPLPFADQLQLALDEALESGRNGHELGVSAALIVPGYEVWTGVSGVSQPGVPVTIDMLFDAGSIEKNFQAALLLKLAEDDLLSLDNPISLYLPYLPNVDGRITIRQLLDHSSGVFNVFEHPDFPWVRPDVDYARDWQLEEVFDAFVLEPYGPPGATQHYSSTNYLLLTAIVEEVTELSVSEELACYFLGPLSLGDVYVTMGEPPPDYYPVAHPWVDHDGDGQLEDLYDIPLNWKSTLTHPTLFATASDLARWMNALYHEQIVLRPESLEEMLSYPEVEIGDPEGGVYGLGVVDYSDILGIHVIGHAGSSLGYTGAALYLPESGVSVTVLINTGESPLTLGGRLLHDIWSALIDVLQEEGIIALEKRGEIQ